MRLIVVEKVFDSGVLSCTVEDYKAKTVVEFINEALEECHKYISFHVVSKDPALCQTIWYKGGVLKQEIPDVWQHVSIQRVMAAKNCSGVAFVIFVR